MMIRLKKNTFMTSIISIVLLLILILALIQRNVGGVTNKIAGLLYNEYKISAEKIFEYENSTIDIDIYDDGKCISQSDDSQIFINPEKFIGNNHVKNIEVKISGLTGVGSQGEYYLFNDKGEIINSEYPIYINGSNIFDVKRGTNIIRFDITNLSGVEFKVENVIFNNNARLTEDLMNSLLWVNWLIVCVVFVFIVYFVFYLIKNTGILSHNNRIASIICILITSVVIGLIYILNPFNISKKVTSDLCISKNITVNDFIDNGQVHDFKVTDNKSLVSINPDPWLVLDLSKYNLNYSNINLLNIVVEDISIDENISEIYYIDKSGQSVFSDKFQLNEGDNIIKVKRTYDNTSVIRLDLATSEDVVIRLNNVIINDNDAIFTEFTNFVGYVSKYIVLMVYLLICYIFGRYINKKKISENKKYINPLWITSVLVLSILLNILIKNGILSYIIMGIAFLFYGIFSERKNYCGKINKQDMTFLIISFGVPILSITSMNNYIPFFHQLKQYDSIIVGWLLFWIVIGVLEIINNFTFIENKIKDLKFVNYIIAAFLLFFIIHSAVYCIYNSYNNLMKIYNFIIFNVWDYSFMFNALIVLGVYILLLSLGGIKFSFVISSIALIISIVGNSIKLIYQGTYLKLADFLLINELFSILNAYIGNLGVILIILVILGIIAVVVFNIKKIINFLDWKINKSVSILCLSIVLIIVTNSMGFYRDLFTDNFNLYEPENYSRESIAKLISSYEWKYDSDNIKPDVILIMSESLFDINKLPNVSFNVDCTENIRKYQGANVISPRYGGGTAAVEFEALTGLTNYFFVDDMVAYNFYFSKNLPVNSLAEEFKNNGYETTAIHANRASFYNRDMVYADMGFDKFYDISSFDISDEDIMKDGFTKDYLFFDKVKNTLEENESSKFIFGVTIEGHSPYTNKFEDTEVKVESPLLSEREISDLEQYAQTVRDTDKEIGKLIEYLENRDKPTLLYLWGDHLPPLSAFSTLGYVNGETYEKYMVPLVVYSNYKKINVDEENISPTVITTQILKDSKISYSRYFDYIIQTQKKYPVIHKKFTEKDDDLMGYYTIIYDVLKGKRYVLDN